MYTTLLNFLLFHMHFLYASLIFSGFLPPACAISGLPPPPPPTTAAYFFNNLSTMNTFFNCIFSCHCHKIYFIIHLHLLSTTIRFPILFLILSAKSLSAFPSTSSKAYATVFTPFISFAEFKISSSAPEANFDFKFCYFFIFFF